MLAAITVKPPALQTSAIAEPDAVPTPASPVLPAYLPRINPRWSLVCTTVITGSIVPVNLNRGDLTSVSDDKRQRR